MSAEAYEYFASLLLTNLVSTDELLMLMTAYTADHLLQDQPHETFPRFDIDNFTSTQCKSLFRFKKDQLIELSELLAMPGEYVAQNGIVWTLLEGTCMLLRCLCYLGRLVDLQPYFGRSVQDCSLIVNNMLADVHH